MGHDKLLLRTRLLILERHFPVETTSSLPLLSALSGRSFALVILCHSLSRAERILATGMVRQMWPEAGILELLSSTQSAAADNGNHVLLGLDGPAALIETVCGMLQFIMPRLEAPKDAPARMAWSRS